MSFMQVCWSLMRYPRSKGIPYIMENGTFDQALVFMLRLFGIMLGLSVVENVIIFFITPVTMLDTIISILGFIFAWIFLKGLWIILAHFYVKATSNRDLTFKETFLYTLFTWTIPTNVKDHIDAYYYHCYRIRCTFSRCIYAVTSIGESYFINIKQYDT